MKILEKIRQTIHQWRYLPSQLSLMNANLSEETIRQIRKESRFENPSHLVHFGQKIYSQNDEDGIIREIFNRIGIENKNFIEFGIGDGLENNSLALVLDNWRGLWIEGSEKYCEKIRSGLERAVAEGSITLCESFITKDNIDQLISSNVEEDSVDLLSIDIDGNDYHVFDAIKCIKPRVVVIEYNPKFPPPIEYCMEYQASFKAKKNDNYGASLAFLCNKLGASGYSLVGCNVSGVNAFFVKTDLAEGKFLGLNDMQMHYQPGRYYLQFAVSGQPASYAVVENRLRE